MTEGRKRICVSVTRAILRLSKRARERKREKEMKRERERRRERVRE